MGSNPDLKGQRFITNHCGHKTEKDILPLTVHKQSYITRTGLEILLDFTKVQLGQDRSQDGWHEIHTSQTAGKVHFMHCHQL